MKYKVVLVAISMMLLAACEKFIDLGPLDQISVDDYWKTTSDLEKYVVKFYPLLDKDEPDDSDDLIYGFDISTILNGERVAATGSWVNDWRRVRDINIFFDNYRKVEDDFDTYKHFVGEAHFFRAWTYFGLLKKYGDLPWYSNALELSDDGELMRPRDPRTLVVDSILMDLDKASVYLDRKVDSGNNRLNKESALAFKTRVALYEGTWQKYHKGTAFGTDGANYDKYFEACIAAGQELMNGEFDVQLYSTGNADRDYFELFGFDNMSSIDEVLLYRAYNAADGLKNRTQAD